jgi:hypothetical protein
MFNGRELPNPMAQVENMGTIFKSLQNDGYCLFQRCSTREQGARVQIPLQRHGFG